MAVEGSMLLEKNISPDDIIAIKIATGEELIAKLVEMSESSVTISRPLVLQIAVDPKTNQLGLQMIPTFMLAATTDSRLVLDRRHVICVSKAADDAKNGYIRNTTNLVVAGQQPGRLQV